MLINFKDIQVSVNGTPLLIESASLQTRTNSAPVFSVGNKNQVGYSIDEPIEVPLNFSYILEVGNDPILDYFQTNKNTNANDYTPLSIVIGNLSGQFFPNNYSLDITRNADILTATVDLTSYNGISGDLQGLASYTYDTSDAQNVAHFWFTKLLINQQHAYVTNKVLDFSYSCEFDWAPIYTIDSKTPRKVLLLGGEENMELNTELYSAINYSGKTVGKYFNTTGMYLQIGCLNESLKTHIGNLASGYVTVSRFDVNERDYVRTKIEIANQF